MQLQSQQQNILQASCSISDLEGDRLSEKRDKESMLTSAVRNILSPEVLSSISSYFLL